MKFHANGVVAGILLYFLILAATYSANTPFFETPDEGSHFLYVHNLLETGELPIIEDRDVVFASGFTERHHPPLYYYLASLLIRFTNRDDLDTYRITNPFAAAGVLQPDNVNGYLHPWRAPTGDSLLALQLGRLVSITLSAGTVWLVYDMTRQAFKRTDVALFAMLLAASVPTFLFISGGMNNDNLVTFVYTAGLAWLRTRTWNAQQISYRAIALLGWLLGAVALSKLNGVNLFGIVYLALIIGAMRGRFGWRNVIEAIGISLALATLIAGWWYLRNFVLYGDFLAVEAAESIWGRGALPTEWSPILGEAWGVWVSFWLVLGKFNVAGPEWFYRYVTVLTVFGVLGMMRVWWTKPHWRPHINIWLASFLLVAASLAVTTRSINASQGRVMFPGLGPLAVFIAGGLFLGWRRRVTLILALPIVVMALIVPVVALSRAYGRLHVVEALPFDVQRLDAYVGGMHWQGYRLEQATVAPGDTLNLELYFSGTDEQHDLVVQAKALDPLNPIELGGTHLFPGMTFTSQLPMGDTIYRVPVAFTIEPQTLPLAPRQLRIFLDVLDGQAALEDQLVKIPWQDADGVDLPGSLNMPGPVLIDPDYVLLEPTVDTNVRFGEGIAPERLYGGDGLDSSR